MWTMHREAMTTDQPSRERTSNEGSLHTLRGDITGNPATWEEMLRDGPSSVDHVVLCAAPARARGDTHASTYPAAARGALRIATLLGARTIIYTSSTGVYGVGDGSVVDESSAVSDADERVRALVEAEQLLLRGDTHNVVHGDVHDVSGKSTRRIVLRVAGLYGPGRDPAERFRAADTREDDGARWCNFAWRDDVCSAVMHLQSDSAAISDASRDANIFNVADGHPVQARDITSWLQREPAAQTNAKELRSTRSNQRVATDKLRATGWRPAVRTVFDGLVMLGHGPGAR